MVQEALVRRKQGHVYALAVKQIGNLRTILQNEIDLFPLVVC